LKRDYPHWLAGKDNYAYQTLGWEELDIFQNVDFYFGELVEHKTHYQQLKNVPEWELWRRLEELERRLEKVEVLTEERDKHLEKLRILKRLGW
jgi:D-mannonate dehydratase